jgi:aminoglycoside/choline kinase family phosphotransferase
MLDSIPHLAELLEAALPGSRALELTGLPGQLSTRRYYRVGLSGPPSSPTRAIVMQLPAEDPDGVALKQAHAFLDIQRFLAAQRLRVPEIYGERLDHRLMLLEDLGDETFDLRLRDKPRAEWPGLYEVAVDNLAELHRAAVQAEPSACVALRRRFESSLLRWELDHFREWGLEALHGPLPAAQRAELDACFDALTSAIVALPVGFVHRDYQSRNLMWAPDGALAIIDFQDAFMGPFAYDLVALLCDSYVDIDASLQDSMLLRYGQHREYTATQRVELVRAFRLIAVQRKLKDAGRFVFIDRVRKNPSFLGYYPGSLRYVARALRELPELATLQALLTALVPGFPT